MDRLNEDAKEDGPLCENRHQLVSVTFLNDVTTPCMHVQHARLLVLYGRQGVGRWTMKACLVQVVKMPARSTACVIKGVTHLFLQAAHGYKCSSYRALLTQASLA